MATTMLPVGGRSVVKCDWCFLVQYITLNNACRKCKHDYNEPLAPPAPVAAATSIPTRRLDVSGTVRQLRHRSGQSQRQLAIKMGCPRSYVSKIENEKAAPTLATLGRLAAALDVTVVEFLDAAEKGRWQEVSVLMKDPFLCALHPFVAKLTPAEMRLALSRIRQFAEPQQLA